MRKKFSRHSMPKEPYAAKASARKEGLKQHTRSVARENFPVLSAASLLAQAGGLLRLPMSARLTVARGEAEAFTAAGPLGILTRFLFNRGAGPRTVLIIQLCSKTDYSINLSSSHRSARKTNGSFRCKSRPACERPPQRIVYNKLSQAQAAAFVLQPRRRAVRSDCSVSCATNLRRKTGAEK